VSKSSEVLLRSQFLDELEEFVDWARTSGEEPDPFEDLPGVWLDELEDTPNGNLPVVMLDPRVLYADSWSPPLLDELLFVHHSAHGWVGTDEVDT